VMVSLFLVGAFCGAFPYVQPGMTAVWHSWLSKSTNANAWHMIGAQILIFALLRSTVMQGILGGVVGRYFGKLSFVLYLIHLPIICSLTAWVAYGMRDMPYLFVVAVAGSVTVAAVFGVSTLLYLYVDVYTTAFSRYAGKLVDAWFSVAAPAFPKKIAVGLNHEHGVS
jgi:peptidoglycan/LPS O-acetylase OafA/YrhL